jgi:hypothetical protein
MNDPRNSEIRDATDGEASGSLSQKISGEVPSNEARTVGNSVADEQLPSAATLVSQLGLVGDPLAGEDRVAESITDEASAPPPPARAAGDPVLLSQHNVSTAVPTSIESPGPTAFSAFCTATNFRTRGIQGETFSDRAGSVGVRGVATNQQGSGSGVEGITVSTNNGAGVFGRATESGGRGVIGVAEGVGNKSDVGVLGLASGRTGLRIGVWGSVISPDGIGVLADSDGVALQARGSTSLEGKLEVGSPTQRSFTVDPANPANGQTAILVLRNVNGTLSLQRVTMGAANSGGTGFRVLRVPN